ncbi:type I 3-dehydroquinate dehydratase [Streptococcus didelphis]
MKIVASVIPRNFEEAQNIDVSKYDGVDLIEWRADFLAKEEIITVAPAIFEKFAGREIIFTLRTIREGGNIELSDQEYIALIKEINAIYNPDYIDFEYFSHKAVFNEMLDFPNLVLSYHNFKETPENLMESFSEMTKLAPRVVKIFVMPNSEQDVLNLMNYTRGFKALNPEQTYATMSMGKLGRISRIASDIIGSSWIFVSIDNNSNAPGQISLNDMKKIIEVLDADS